ncbi:helix-turn-helix domain-containing protein [Amycolatopsis sp. NPDC004378]
MPHGSPSYQIDGPELRRRRENAGWSLRDFAEKCRETGQPVDHSQISTYEQGRRNPRPRALKAMAEALGCEPDDLKRALPEAS